MSEMCPSLCHYEIFWEADKRSSDNSRITELRDTVLSVLNEASGESALQIVQKYFIKCCFLFSL